MSLYREGDRVRNVLDGEKGARGTVVEVFTQAPPAGMPWFDSPAPWYMVAWDTGTTGAAEAPSLARVR
jgi:hypothetical protein